MTVLFWALLFISVVGIVLQELRNERRRRARAVIDAIEAKLKQQAEARAANVGAPPAQPPPPAKLMMVSFRDAGDVLFRLDTYAARVGVASCVLAHGLNLREAPRA